MRSLERLPLARSLLPGPAPAEIGAASSATGAGPGSSALAGHPPAEGGLLPQLQSLPLCNGVLSGSIMSEVGSWMSLELLCLHDNLLTGSAPSEAGLLMACLVQAFMHEAPDIAVSTLARCASGFLLVSMAPVDEPPLQIFCRAWALRQPRFSDKRARALVITGASLVKQQRFQWSPAEKACTRGHLEGAGALLKQPCQVASAAGGWAAGERGQGLRRSQASLSAPSCF